jgi:hypothetical protein
MTVILGLTTKAPKKRRENGMMRKLICLDFDGVIHNYRRWKGPTVIDGGPVKATIEWIRIHASHYQIVVHTSRASTDEGREAVAKALEEWGISGCVSIAAEKPPAFLTIDDRAILFTGTMPTVDEIERFKPWWDQPKPPEGSGSECPPEA